MDGNYVTVSPEKSEIGEKKIRVKPARNDPNDGKLLFSQCSFNSSALTGDSIQKPIREGEMVLQVWLF